MNTEHNFDAENQALLQEDEKVATETPSNKEGGTRRRASSPRSNRSVTSTASP